MTIGHDRSACPRDLSTKKGKDEKMKIMDDALIRDAVIRRLERDSRVDASQIAVDVQQGTVTLKGDVPTYLGRSAAGECARGILGVMRLRNDLLVNYPPARRVPSDGTLAENVRNRLDKNPDLDLLNMEVTVKDGVVTLKGTVDAYWKKLYAEELTATEGGVRGIENHMAVVPTEDIMDKAIADGIIDTFESEGTADVADIDVTVKDGHVTLSGTVPGWGTHRAVCETVYYTSGVTSFTNNLEIGSV